MNGCKVLVTGGAGFIGLHLVEALLKLGAKVTVLDTQAHHLPNDIQRQVDMYIGDVRNASTCLTATRDCKYVFHLAARISVPESIQKPRIYNNVNVDGTINILDAAAKNKVERVIFSSSAAVYGNIPGMPKSEDAQLSPQSPYAFSKLVGEQYCQMYSNLYNLSTISLRYFNVFGARQSPESAYASVVPAFLKAFSRNKPVTIHGDGLQIRDFCHVDNIVQANILAALNEKSRLMGQAVNIGCMNGVSIKRLYEVCCELTQKSIEPIYTASREGDIKTSIANIDKANTLLGYEPKVNFEEGMKRTVESYVSSS